MIYELGSRAACDLREESSEAGRRLFDQLLAQRIDDPAGEGRWPREWLQRRYDGEGHMREWQHAQCCGLRAAWAYGPLTKRCEHRVHLTQEQAARHVCGEPVEVYCSWCSYDLERGKSSVARLAVAS